MTISPTIKTISRIHLKWPPLIRKWQKTKVLQEKSKEPNSNLTQWHFLNQPPQYHQSSVVAEGETIFSQRLHIKTGPSSKKLSSHYTN